MCRKVIVIGAGGHGRVVADVVNASGDIFVGFLDDSYTGQSGDTQLLGRVEDYTAFAADHFFIVAIGDPKIRRKIVERLESVRWYTAIHPTAVISKMGVSIDEGSAIMANAVVNPYAKVGCHCIVNTAAVVEHDNVIGDYAHISVGAKLGGTVQVGRNTWVGIGACVKNNVCICDNCMIGAGAVVLSDIDVSGTYYGLPARFIHAG